MTIPAFIAVAIFVIWFVSHQWNVGPILGADGSTAPVSAGGRQGKTGEAVVTSVYGQYYEASSRGIMFASCDQGAGVVVQTSITTTAAYALYNPLNSGKRLHLSYLSIAYFSGTLGAGCFYHGVLPPGSTLPTGGTAPAITCLDVGNQSGVAGVGVFRTGATVVAALATEAILSTFPELATTANGLQPAKIAIDGAIVLEPGAQYQLLGVFGAGGSSPKITGGMAWLEIPIVASNG